MSNDIYEYHDDSDTHPGGIVVTTCGDDWTEIRAPYVMMPPDERRKLARALDPDGAKEHIEALVREQQENADLRLEVARLRAAAAEVGPDDGERAGLRRAAAHVRGALASAKDGSSEPWNYLVSDLLRLADPEPTEAAPKGGAPEPSRCTSRGPAAARCDLKAGHAGGHMAVRGDGITRTSMGWSDTPEPPAAPLPEPLLAEVDPETGKCLECGGRGRLMLDDESEDDTDDDGLVPCPWCPSAPAAAAPLGAGPEQMRRIREGLDAWASKLLTDRSDETVEAAVRALWLYRDTLIAAPIAPQGGPDGLGKAAADLRKAIMEAVQIGEWNHCVKNDIDDAIVALQYEMLEEAQSVDGGRDALAVPVTERPFDAGDIPQPSQWVVDVRTVLEPYGEGTPLPQALAYEHAARKRAEGKLESLRALLADDREPHVWDPEGDDLAKLGWGTIVLARVADLVRLRRSGARAAADALAAPSAPQGLPPDLDQRDDEDDRAWGLRVRAWVAEQAEGRYLSPNAMRLLLRAGCLAAHGERPEPIDHHEMCDCLDCRFGGGPAGLPKGWTAGEEESFGGPLGIVYGAFRMVRGKREEVWVDKGGLNISGRTTSAAIDVVQHVLDEVARRQAASPPHGERPEPCRFPNCECPAPGQCTDPPAYVPKVGDRVACEAFTDEESPSCGWEEEMAESVGVPGRVDHSDHDGDVYVLHDNGDAWFWPASKVRPTSDEPRREPNELGATRCNHCPAVCRSRGGVCLFPGGADTVPDELRSLTSDEPGEVKP